MLNVFLVSSATALVVNLVLGVCVYFMNPRRRANSAFLLVSFTLALWLATCVGAGASMMDGNRIMQAFWIRLASLAVGLVPMVFDVLRIAVTRPQERTWAVMRQLFPWFVFALLTAATCFSPWFVLYVRDNPAGGIPVPVYGLAQRFYIVLWLYALGFVGWRYTRDLRGTTGIQQVELQFAVLAFTVSAVMGVMLSQVIPLITGFESAAQFLPLSAIVLSGIIAYGIVTQRIMSVNDVLRRSSAYALLTVYLCLLYLTLQWLGERALAGWLSDPRAFAHVLATLSVVLSMAPAHGRMQRVTNRLFINMQTLDVQRTMRQAQAVLLSIGTTAELLQRFARILTQALGTDRVSILVSNGEHFQQAYPNPPGNAPAIVLEELDPLVRMLRVSEEPVSLDSLRRMRPDPIRSGARQRLTEHDAVIAMGIRLKSRLEGVVLLGCRLSGRIYGATEQEAIQLLCNQLGVALDNAKLYTAVQDSKIYNDILLDNLVSGVIAVNADNTIGYFNREAERIIGLPAREMLHRDVGALPGALADILRTTHRTGRGEHDLELVAMIDGRGVHLRVGSSLLHGHTGETLGALLVFHDMTEMHRLQEQIRRSDRLASMGTLSAGMAHEIKNPLVTIKTFTQLLPERFEDPEFRESFASLVGAEVKRIDTIVSQLLTFARPSKPVISEIRLRNVLDESLRLVEQEMRRKSITVFRSYTEDDDTIHGDADLLSQAFVNFFLNAQEAMQDGGELHVGLHVTRDGARGGWSHAARSLVEASIRDTGQGILPDDLDHIFDPFFTTKSEGTGLGLSVSHGIIDEQHGVIDVVSEVGKGTMFTIRFPRIRREDDT
jgi:PAS domain S-box-containing protein